MQVEKILNFFVKATDFRCK